MKQSFEIQIKPDRRMKKIVLLAAEWPKRTEHLRKLLPYLAARYVLAQILEKVPKDDEWAAYRSSLDVAAITGAPRGMSAYVLRANNRDRRVREVDAPKTIIYVRARKKLRRVKPEIAVLEKFSPWTLQTLPFTPKRSEALLVSRRVSKREVDFVAKSRMRDRPQWRKELDKLGIREVKKDHRLTLPKTPHALPDVAFEALRLEFGLGGVKGRPHWRSSIRKLIKTGIKSMLRHDQHLKQTFTKASFRGWKRWPPRTPHKVRMGEARNYLPFQRKLGIRI